MSEEIAIYRYEQFIMRNARFILYGSPSVQEADAKAVVRYAITKILGWTPKQAYDHITYENIQQMQLDKVAKYISYPKDVDRILDPDYLVSAAFPEIRFDHQRQIMRIYERILDNTYPNFPKKIFDGPDGLRKASYLLNEVLSVSIPSCDVEQLYQLFANEEWAKEFLAKTKLSFVCRKLYASPLDFLHFSLPDGDRDELLYAIWQYKGAAFTMKKSLEKKWEKKKTDNANDQSVIRAAWLINLKGDSKRE